MTRPLYETGDDIARERAIAVRMAELWDCTMHKLPIKYRLEFAMTRSGKTIAFCEIKSRNYSWEEFERMGGYMLAADKWMGATHLCRAAGLPFILAVDASGDLRYQIFREFPAQRIAMRGRTDRNDWQDIEPCVLFDCNNFRRWGT